MSSEIRSKDIRIGMCPDMHPKLRHGTVWFEVSGFGRVRRDFLVDEPEALAKNVEVFAPEVISQIRLLDNTLPKKEKLCKPVMLDILGDGVRRIYRAEDYSVMFEQPI